jgi:hypothetical protein
MPLRVSRGSLLDFCTDDLFESAEPLTIRTETGAKLFENIPTATGRSLIAFHPGYKLPFTHQGQPTYKSSYTGKLFLPSHERKHPIEGKKLIYRGDIPAFFSMLKFGGCKFASTLAALDLAKVTLLAFEEAKPERELAKYTRYLSAGAQFPAVPVIKLDDTTYSLSPEFMDANGEYDGGHHRALIHLRTGKPLPCEVHTNPLYSQPSLPTWPISDVKIHH